MKRVFSRILSLIPHDALPRPGGEAGRLSVSHFTHSEDRPMRLVQCAGPVTKPPRHHPGVAYAPEMGAARSVDKCGLCAKLVGQITADSVAIVAGQHLKESERLEIFSDRSLLRNNPAHLTSSRVLMLWAGISVPARIPMSATSSWSRDSLLNCHGEPTSHAHHS